LLDDHLGESITARLVSHSTVSKLITGFNAPLGTFSARITGALALGVISEDEYHDLEIIRVVRNHFAHQLKASFATTASKTGAAISRQQRSLTSRSR
jgi:DNA-binding MltR family transcriptional regulator